MATEAQTYTLKHPVQDGANTVTTLAFRRPKGKDMLDLPAGGSISVGDLLRFAGRLTGTLSHVMNELDAEDVVEVCDIAANFLQRGPRTGETPSA